jgi:hypothetical protein
MDCSTGVNGSVVTEYVIASGDVTVVWRAKVSVVSELLDGLDIRSLSCSCFCSV